MLFRSTDRISPDDKVAMAAKNAYGIEPDLRFWLYFGWIARYLELFTEIRRTRKLVPLLKTPCLVFQSQKDELVAKSSVKYFDSKVVKTVFLQNSCHYYYDEQDYDLLLKEFSKSICEKI